MARKLRNAANQGVGRLARLIWVFFSLSLLLSSLSLAQSNGDEANLQQRFKSLDREIQALKTEALEINQELLLLERELLFPSGGQLSVFVSMNAESLFQVDSVQVKLDGELIANHPYSGRESDALRRGGKHPIHTSNLSSGKHRLVASVVGTAPNGRHYQREAELTITKSIGPKHIELIIEHRGNRQKPKLLINQW